METRTAQVRAAALADIPELASLVEQYWAFEGIDGFSRLQVERNLTSLLSSSHLGRAWVASEGARLCGYILVAHVFSLEHGGVMAEIDEFFVLPEYRANRVGNALLNEAERQLAATGCVRMQLQLGRSNDAARKFYLRHGYLERSEYEFLDKALTQG